MALGQAAKISLSQHSLAPQNTQENAQLTARGCPGRAKPWEPRKNLFQRSPALPLPHQPLLPCTSQPPFLGISWQHLPRLAAPSQAGSTTPDQHCPGNQRAVAFHKPRHSARSVSFLFTTILYYYLFIRSYFYFALNMPSCVILVLLKM